MGVYARPDSPTWWMRIEATGQRTSTGIPKDGGSPAQHKELRRQAQEVYALAEAKAVQQKHQPAEKPARTFTQHATWYAQHLVAGHRGAEKERSMLGQLTAHFRQTPLSAIDDAAVREWMTTRSAHVSKATVNRELDLLKALIRSAVPKYLDATPLSEIRRFRVDEREPRVLTEDEEARLLAVCNPSDRALIILALDTLLRLSSVVRLEWPQVKLAQRVVLPLNAKVRTDAKPLSTRLLAALEALPSRTGYVFPQFHERTSTGARARVMARFAQLCALAHVPHGRAVNGVTFHCLRHTGATRALQRGSSLRTVMQLGGWKNTDTVLRYLHTSDADVIDAAESIGRIT